jgi:hypothetical protein
MEQQRTVFGRPFLGSLYEPKRLRERVSLNAPDPAALDSPLAMGYPFHGHESSLIWNGLMPSGRFPNGIAILPVRILPA